MILGIPKETFADEKRVALTPAAVATLSKLKLEVHIERGAGEAAGFTDEQYEQRGAKLADRAALFSAADIIAQVRAVGANPEQGAAEVDQLRRDQIVIGHAEPLTAHEQTQAVAERGATLLAMELIPRITRAQAMDALSSQANLAGYMTVLLAATQMPKAFPMMMTAAGTIKPAKVFVIGAGVAGLQAVATAKRLGAVVSATDVRPATQEQVESLGGKFVFLEEIMTEGEGGYARELTPEQQEKQKALVADVVAESDVVITTAAIPGRKAPVLVTEQTVQRMNPRSVIVDMAAERGGNCELTEAGQVVVKHGVTIIGTTNLPAMLAQDASAMYAGNIVKLLQHLVDDQGNLKLDMEDQITAGIVVTREGQVVHPKVRELMGLGPMTAEHAAQTPSEPGESAEATQTPPAPEGAADQTPTDDSANPQPADPSDTDRPNQSSTGSGG